MPETKPVDPAAAGKKTSDIVPSPGEVDTADLGEQGQNCFWNDEEYPEGTQISVDGKNYECSFGRWVAFEE